MTKSDLIQDGIRYIPSKAAAKGVGLSPDYISRLCREGQVLGAWHRGAWYVHEPSLARFAEEKRRRQEELARQQAQKLKREREQAETAARKAATIAKWRSHARPIALATITLLIATSATALARPALEHISAQLPSNTQTQLASVATSLSTLRNIASNITSSITDTIGNFFAPVQNAPTPIVFIPKTATSSPQQITQTNPQPPSQTIVNQPIVERVVEQVRTVVSGGVSEALLDARLAALDRDLTSRMTSLSLASTHQTNTIYNTVSQALRIEELTDLILHRPRIDGGTITGATISGGSLSGVALHIDAGDISGVLGVAQGGTGTATSPLYGQLLLGNSSGGYDLVATSSLGIAGGGGGGGAAFGQTWEIANNALAPTTTLGIIVSASSTFTGGLSATYATATHATSTSLFASLARFTTGIIDALTAAAATITDLTATTLTAQNASTTIASAYDGIFVGRTATTTIRGNATSTFAAGIETTALNVTSATSTFANGIQLAAGCFRDASGSCITGGGGGAWGTITGTLSDQTDLQSALDASLSLADWYATTTDALAEGASNRYYADARVQTYLDTLDKGFFFATTSADYWQDNRNFFSTTSADYYVSVTDLFSTTSAQYFAHSSTTIPKTYTANVFTALQTFGNASTTNLSATYASSTQGFFGSLSLGNLTGFLKATAGAIATAAIDLATDVTGILGVGRGGTGWAAVEAGSILYGNGGSSLATTSAGTAGQVLALLNGVPTWTATTTFSSGLTYSGGNVTLDTSGNWSGTFDGEQGSYYLNAANLTNFGVPFYSFFSATTTSALAEGSNLYWTNARFDTRLAATTSLPNLTTLANLASVGTLASGSIASGFGAIDIGSNNLTAGAASLEALTVSGNTTLSHATATSLFASSLLSPSATFGFLTATSSSATSSFAGSILALGPAQFANSSNFFGSTAFGATGTTTIATDGTISAPSVLANSATAYTASIGALNATSSLTAQNGTISALTAYTGTVGALTATSTFFLIYAP